MRESEFSKWRSVTITFLLVVALVAIYLGIVLSSFMWLSFGIFVGLGASKFTKLKQPIYGRKF